MRCQHLENRKANAREGGQPVDGELRGTKRFGRAGRSVQVALSSDVPQEGTCLDESRGVMDARAGGSDTIVRVKVGGGKPATNALFVEVIGS